MLQAGRCDASHHLGNGAHLELAIARVFPFRGRRPGNNPGPPAGAAQDGQHNSSVVPGYVVDSRVTSCPGRRVAAIWRAVFST